MQRWERSSLAAAAAGAHHILRGGACAARQRAFINNRRKITIKISRFPRADDASSCQLTKTGMERKKSTRTHTKHKKDNNSNNNSNKPRQLFLWKLEGDAGIRRDGCFLRWCWRVAASLLAVFVLFTRKTSAGRSVKPSARVLQCRAVKKTLFLRPAIKTRVVVVVVVVVAA